MRDGSQESALGPDQRFDAAGHYIEVTTKLSDFIAPLQQSLIYPCTQITRGQLMRGAAQLDDWHRQVAGKPKAEQTADQEDRQETSRDYPHTKGQRSRFSESRRRARKIRLRQHTCQNITRTLRSANQVSSKRTRLLWSKIKHVKRLIREPAECLG